MQPTQLNGTSGNTYNHSSSSAQKNSPVSQQMGSLSPNVSETTTQQLASFAKYVENHESSFRLEEQTPAPYPYPPLFDAKERSAKYKDLLKIGSNPVPQGFSRLIDIFSDYLDDCLHRCALDLKNIKQNKDIHQFCHKVLQILSANFNEIMGTLQEVVTENENVLYVNAVDIAREKFMGKCEYICTLINVLPKENRSTVDLTECFLLLKDTICQDFQALSHYEKKDNLPQNLERIMKRITRIRHHARNLKEEEETLQIDSKSDFKNSNYLHLWENDKHAILEYCNKIEAQIRQFNHSPSPAHVIHLYGLFNDCSFHRGNLIFSLMWDNQTIIPMRYLNQNVIASLITIKNQGKRSIFHHLIVNKAVNPAHYIRFLHDYGRILNSMQKLAASNEYKERQARIETLKTLPLSEDEKQVISFLEQYCNDIPFKGILTCINILKQQVQRNLNKYKSAQTTGDLVLNLQPIIECLRGSNSANEKNLKSILNSKQVLFKDKQISQEITQLFLQLESRIEFLNHALSVPYNLLEGLFQKGFQKLQENSENEEKQKDAIAANNAQTLLDDIKGKSKKKKKKTSSPPQTSASSTHLISSTTSEIGEEKPPAPQPAGISKKKAKAAKIEAQKSQEAEDHLTQILKLAAAVEVLPLQGADAEYRQTWRNAALKNLSATLGYFEETSAVKEFSRDKIFSETNLMRQLLEAVLETALAQFAAPDDEEQSVLHQVNSHELHQLVKKLMEHKAIPANIRNIVFALRSTAYALSQANACVNYPFTTAVKTQLPPQAQNLVNYLIKVDELSAAEEPNRGTQISLLKTHQKLVSESLLLAAELLKGMTDPNHGLSNYLPAGEALEEVLDLPDFDVSETQRSQTTEKAQAYEKDFSMPLIRDRKEALQAIQMAKRWVLIRTIGAVEEGPEEDYRIEQRNLALKNVYLYLELLEEKLSREQLQPSNMSYGVLGLLRRIHKELCISVLYHGAHYEAQIHLIDDQKLRHQNDPCYLHDLAVVYAAWPGELAKTEEILWMQNAHQVLSYPTPLEPGVKREAFDLAEIIKEVRAIVEVRKQNAKNKTLVEPGFTLVGPGGMKISPEKEEEDLTERTKKLETGIENGKIFPALFKISMILRHGFEN